jgi:hypothetical protein
MAAAKLRHVHPTTHHGDSSLEAEARQGHRFGDVLAHRDLRFCQSTVRLVEPQTLVCRLTTDNMQEHRAVLDLSGDSTRKRGRSVGLAGGGAGALQLATSFHATDTRTDKDGSS